MGSDFYYEKYEDVLIEILEDLHRIRSSGEKFRQSWEVIPFNRAKRVWLEYSRTGLIRDEKGFEKIESILITNTVKLDINTSLCGHSTSLPDMSDMPEHLVFQYDDFENDDYGWAVYDYFCCPVSGQLRITDYGLDGLCRNLKGLLEARTDAQRIMYADLMLNVTHQRSDLASWFIEGGAKALSEISILTD